MEKETDVLVQTMQEVMDKLAELNQELESMVSSTMKDTSTQEPPCRPQRQCMGCKEGLGAGV